MSCMRSLKITRAVHAGTAVAMPVICIGPICVPMNLLLPFLLGVLHSYGEAYSRLDLPPDRSLPMT